MIQLSDMQLAREVERQRSELHILCGMPEEIEVSRGLRFLDAGGPDDLNEIVGVMRDCRDRLDADGWRDAGAALFCVASDHQVAEWKVLEATVSRVFDRLHDRIESGADREELASRAATIIEMTGAAITSFCDSVRYRRASGAYAWETKFTMHLDHHAGPQEEREAYQQTDFGQAQKLAYEHYFGESLPPLGMWYTAACIAADLVDRYRPRDGMPNLHAIETATDIIGHAVASLAL